MEQSEQKLQRSEPLILPEEEFAERMQSQVEPYLARLCQKGRCAGGDIYYELYSIPDAKAMIVISHGFIEAGKKYHEFIYYLLQAGFSCAILDHRGHGLSVRNGKDGNVIYVRRFDRYLQDLHDFVHEVVVPAARDLPLYLYGHSMGGCIAARYLEEWPEDFLRAVLNAPMIGINMGPLPAWAGLLICNFFLLLGKGEKRLFFQKEFRPDEKFADGCDTSEARFDYYLSLRREEPALQTSGASYNWVRESILAGRKARANAEKIHIPVLLFQAAEDTLVSAKAQEKFLKALPSGKKVKITGSKHEIYMSGNEVLHKYMKIIQDFFS